MRWLLVCFAVGAIAVSAVPARAAEKLVHSAESEPDVAYRYVYARSTAGMDANLSRARGTIRVGSMLFRLEACAEPTGLVCIKSEYFHLYVPDGPMPASWSSGGVNFSTSGETDLGFIESRHVMVVYTASAEAIFAG